VPSKRRPISYAWARHVRELGADRRLSSEGWEGLEYAEQLTEAAAFRAEEALRGGPLPPPMTIEELAAHHAVSPTTVRRRIKQARQEAFGDLSDAGIYYRSRARRRRAGQPVRVCHEAGCDTPLPRNAPAHRRYCDAHSGGAARTRRHRQSKRS
jgi:hypothetical protein